MSPTKHLSHAFGKGLLAGAVAGPLLAWLIGSYGWRVVSSGKQPFWLRLWPLK